MSKAPLFLTPVRACALVPYAGQGVPEGLAVQVADKDPHMVDHLLEGLGEDPNLIVSFIIQVYVIIPFGDLLGSMYQLYQRIGDLPHQ